MQIKQIPLRMAEKINVGAYETIEPDVGLMITLDEGEDPVDAELKALPILQKMWDQMAMKMLSEVKQRRLASGNTKDMPLVDDLRKFFAEKT